MNKLLMLVMGLMLLAGCSTENRDTGAAGAGTTEGISGGTTGTPSGTTEDPKGAGGGGVSNPKPEDH